MSISSFLNNTQSLLRFGQNLDTDRFTGLSFLLAYNSSRFFPLISKNFTTYSGFKHLQGIFNDRNSEKVTCCYS